MPMTEKQELEILNRAIFLYGETNQICKFIEECSELIQTFIEGDIEHTEEELADVFITFKSLCLITGYNSENDSRKLKKPDLPTTPFLSASMFMANFYSLLTLLHEYDVKNLRYFASKESSRVKSSLDDMASTIVSLVSICNPDNVWKWRDFKLSRLKQRLEVHKHRVNPLGQGGQ